jgi:hypothetical protein
VIAAIPSACGIGAERDAAAGARGTPAPELAPGPARALAGARAEEPAPPRTAAAGPAAAAAGPAAAPPRPESSLGIADRGIWPDLDPHIQVRLPAPLDPGRVTAVVDAARALLVISIDGFPRKAYPLGAAGAAPASSAPAALEVGPFHLALRPGDRAELAPLLAADRIAAATAPAPGAPRHRPRDADGDGVPDPLDVLIGAKKTARNADAYTEGYVAIAYPMGDVPRAMGVCTDVIVRAVRNAGIDLQRALHEDIRRAPAAYPMIRGRPDPSIDQRRVATLLPYFRRHWDRRSPAIDDPRDPLQPGDVLFMDTFPGRAGPDHVGIVSDEVGAGGRPLVINNWTTGTVTAEMDLLGFVPVLHRFRLPP